jgi:hypothetical protein
MAIGDNCVGCYHFPEYECELICIQSHYRENRMILLVCILYGFHLPSIMHVVIFRCKTCHQRETHTDRQYPLQDIKREKKC